MEERATEKQIEFAKKLGISGTERLTKHTVRELIKAKLEEGNGEQKYVKPHTEGYGAPVEKVSNVEWKSEVKTTKEYHLSPEQVRSNALACAIEAIKFKGYVDNDNFMEIAKEFVKWINGNN